MSAADRTTPPAARELSDVDSLTAPRVDEDLDETQQALLRMLITGRREGYQAAILAFHEAHPDHCGGECFRWSSVDSALAELTPDPHGALAAVADPRVDADEYVVYPTGYEQMTCVDKDKFCLTVSNGHQWGWAIRDGRRGGGSRAMNRKGEFIVESSGHAGNKARRWPLAEALAIALQHVDTRTVMGRTAADWIPVSKPTDLTPATTPGEDA